VVHHWFDVYDLEEERIWGWRGHPRAKRGTSQNVERLHYL